MMERPITADCLAILLDTANEPMPAEPFHRLFWACYDSHTRILPFNQTTAFDLQPELFGDFLNGLFQVLVSDFIGKRDYPRIG
ncbi:MAG: hypothetical protein ACREBD_01285 [Blastocatellia bacterium]